jgi:hypothetical protein
MGLDGWMLVWIEDMRNRLLLLDFSSLMPSTCLLGKGVGSSDHHQIRELTWGEGATELMTRKGSTVSNTNLPQHETLSSIFISELVFFFFQLTKHFPTTTTLAHPNIATHQ